MEDRATPTIAGTNEPKIFSDLEIRVLTTRFTEARNALYAFAAWPSDIKSISPDEAKELDKFPSREKIEYLARVVCQVERALEHLRGKQVERKKTEPVEEDQHHGMILGVGNKLGTFNVSRF